jgi:glycosyltransferase, group 1 family
MLIGPRINSNGPIGGQNVKFETLVKGFLEYDEFIWNICDTSQNITEVIKKFIGGINSSVCIFCVASRGLKIFLPLLYIWKKITHKQVFHYVVGGTLDEIVKKNTRYIKYLKEMTCNWVETDSLKLRLEELGIENCEVIPNFKKYDMRIEKYKQGDNICFCYIGRVIKEKGVSKAIEAVEKYNNIYEKKIYFNIWGPISEGYKQEFIELTEGKEFIKYQGVLRPEKVIEEISDCYAMLFPTYWHGEGFPGVCVDALFAGIPVIASDWNLNKEVIQDGLSGIVYPNNNVNTLYEAICWSVEHKEAMDKMRKYCQENSHNYSSDKWIPYLYEKIKTFKKDIE